MNTFYFRIQYKLGPGFKTDDDEANSNGAQRNCLHNQHNARAGTAKV